MSNPRSVAGSSARTRSTVGSSSAMRRWEEENAAIIRTQLQQTYDYFMFFHLGVAAACYNQNPDSNERRYGQYDVPRSSAPRFESPTPRARNPYYLLPPRDVDPDIAAQLDAELRGGTHPLNAALGPAGLRFVKILGAGSQGTAVLFDIVDDNGTTRKVVAKYSSGDDDDDDDDGLAGEKGWMRRQFIHGFDVTEDNDDDSDDGQHRDDQDIYLMEFMKHGTVDKILRSVSQSQVQLNSGDLWRIFHCLFRACIALAYPNRWAFGLRAEHGDRVPLSEELVPTEANGLAIPPEDDAIINLDMNANNVMIGDFDSDPGVHPHDQFSYLQGE
ncbi:hypothetical protein Daus18300_008025 [Diaporthe australafricana]|uniref:Protein kinase domain-containing protein n=1 Tax=Diaporthe australafricana TaxID=127596 RepID=A0ABR3WK31_9PEZI